ncbi:MAG: FkbM family methyltransferase [Candidatus Accumulibacter sp.]|jgi:FkbM family methyltransferase|nr:FkbM family methyltransferase [Accumulibacter sp.]
MENGGLDRAAERRRLAGRFEAGDDAGAEEIARRLAAADERDGEARYLLAQALFRQGRTDEAADWMRRALDLDPARAVYHNDYGVMLAALARWPEAAAAYGMAAALEPDYVDARFNLALALLRSDKLERARAELDRLRGLRPDWPEASALEGELLVKEGAPAKAAEVCRKAIANGLETPEIYVALGLALDEIEHGDEAVQAFRRADRLAGGSATACFHLGGHYREADDPAHAARFFRRAIDIAPRFAEAHNNLGLALQERGDAARAEACFRHALTINPGLVAARVNLGDLFMDEGRTQEALECFRRALDLDGNLATAWNNMGLAYQLLERMDEAEAALRRALELEPDSIVARQNMGFYLLLRGRLAEGWPYYEYRWKNPKLDRHRPKFSQSWPEWDGGDLGRRTLLVYAEQGYGDNLQFIRYLPLLRQRCPEARILYWCPPAVYRLFTLQAPAWGVETLPPSMPQGVPPCDAQIALMSLPWRMGTTLENIPGEVPYIAAPKDEAREWAARLDARPGLKVGLVWAGGHDTGQYKFRDMRLEEFRPLFDAPGIDWISLQKGDAAGQIAAEGLSATILDPMDEVEDFAGTAAIVANLDLVVSVDTAVAHLAGAMGKPVWLLSRFGADWRWMLGREDSPWYPTMRIFRQSAPGEWEPVVARVREALAAWAAQDGTPGALAASPGEARFDEAIGASLQELEQAPEDARRWARLGHLCLEARRFDEAERALRTALRLDPDDARAAADFGFMLLLAGELSQGWPYWEARRRLPDAPPRPADGPPEWTGEPLDDRRIVVYGEASPGDDIQFSRYLTQLSRMYPEAAIAYLCPPPLWRLFERFARARRIVLIGSLAELGSRPADYGVGLASLPRLFDTTLQSIPPTADFVLDAKIAERWAEKFAKRPAPRVGLLWSSGEPAPGGEGRALSREEARDLFAAHGFTWVSLQATDNDAEGVLRALPPGVEVYDPMPDAADFADAAAIVAQLDLVICADSALAHLAGSLDCPVWLVLPEAADWRWLVGRDDSPWYPSMRIFRRAPEGEAPPLVNRLREALAAWAEQQAGEFAENFGARSGPGAAAIVDRAFGGHGIGYRIVAARHGWMLANPRDFYIGRALLEYGEYSEIEGQFLRRCLCKPGRIVEAGANIGSLTVGLAQAAAARGETMEVFEPQPVIFQNLCANLALNGLRNVRAWPFACGDEAGTVSFAEPDYGQTGNFGDVQMSREEAAPGRVRAPCVRLDDVLGEEPVALIKADIEGFELAALRGAQATIERWRPILYVENNQPGDVSRALIEWLWSRGYRLYWHAPRLFNPDNHFARNRNLYGNVASYNMLCLPNEFHADFPDVTEVVDSSRHPLER